MGFKTTNYKVEAFGITVPEAYARVTDVSLNMKGEAIATFEIQKTRNDVKAKHPFSRVQIKCDIDKEQPLHKQIYEKAKEEYFKEWEDDIVGVEDVGI
jgi:stringent starvation protein B